MTDCIKWAAHALVERWDDDAATRAIRKLYRESAFVSGDDFASLKMRPDEVREGPNPGNQFVSVGLTQLISRLITTAQVWSTSTGGAGFTGLGVGTSTTPDAVSDSNLIGTKSFRVCDDTYPQAGAAGVVVFKTSFQTAEANFAWEEYGAIIPGAGATSFSGAAVTTKPTNYILLDRKSPAGLGTKASGISTLTLTLTLT